MIAAYGTMAIMAAGKKFRVYERRTNRTAFESVHIEKARIVAKALDGQPRERWTVVKVDALALVQVQPAQPFVAPPPKASEWNGLDREQTFRHMDEVRDALRLRVITVSEWLRRSDEGWAHLKMLRAEGNSVHGSVQGNNDGR